MPINELERHPFLNYLDEDNQIIRHDYTGLIIGSFPVYSCTDTLDNLLQIEEQRFDPENVTMRFFYCSNRSKFWKYISEAHEEPNPVLPLPEDNVANRHALARQRTVTFLQENRLLITDVLKQTNRNEYGDEDSNLWITNNVDNFILNNLALNESIIQLLQEHQTIENLYFTATGLIGKSPFGWFKQIFNNEIIIHQQNIIDNRRWSLTCTINDRHYNVFMLPTPKPRGIHFTDNQRTQMFVNYLQDQANNFYNEIVNIPKAQRIRQQEDMLETHRNAFLIECYRQAFGSQNLNFNGQVANP